MNLFLAHSAETGKWMFIVGGVLGIVFVLWLLVVGAQRNILWVLAVLLVPPAALILVFVDSKALRPGLCYIGSLALAFWGFAGIDHRSHLSLESRAELFAKEVAGTPSEKLPTPSPNSKAADEGKPNSP